MAKQNKEEMDINAQLTQILANQTKQEAHLKVYRDNQLNTDKNIQTIMVAITGNEFNGKKGILSDIEEIKQKQLAFDKDIEDHEKMLKEHKPIVGSLKYVYGAIVIAFIAFLFSLASPKQQNQNPISYNQKNK